MPSTVKPVRGAAAGFITSFAASALLLSVAQAATPGYITAAVADASRPAADTQRDADRKPAEVLAFAGVKPGDAVGELMPGRGYYTRLLCKIVGEKGHVYGVNTEMAQPMPGPAAAPAPQAPPCPNVSSTSVKASALALPGPLDVVWTSENYHDWHTPLFGSPDMKAFNRVIFEALKPGGVYIVEDHAAAAGSGLRDTGTLHRIDPQTTIAEITSVGFVLDGRSDLLSNPADPHTEAVFKMGGKSDKFLLKFRKPAKK